MNERFDEKFFKRADEHIELSNTQTKTGIGNGKVSASMMYATARFNTWLSATGHATGGDMKSVKTETVDYFCQLYRTMLEEHLNEYITNFSSYMPGQ